MNAKQWAILLILVIIPIIILWFLLYYFGMFNESQYIPDQCAITSGFTCRDYFVNKEQVAISVINNLGEPISVDNFSVSQYSRAGLIFCYSEDVYSLIPNGTNFNLSCTKIPETWQLNNGRIAKFGFEFSYIKEGQYFAHKVTGTITSTIGINDLEYQRQRVIQATITFIAIIVGFVLITGLYVLGVIKLIKKLK